MKLSISFAILLSRILTYSYVKKERKVKVWVDDPNRIPCLCIEAY